MKNMTIELHDQDITQKGVAAIIDFYRTISIDTMSCPDVFAFVTGIDSPFLNVVIDTRQQRKNSSDLIERVSDFFTKHVVPWGWFVTPGAHQNDLNEQGFSLIEEAAAMYCDLSNPLPVMKHDDIIMQEVEKGDDLKVWIQPINEGFGTKEGDESYRVLNVEKSRTGKLRHFVAYYQNTVATAGTLFLSQDSVMLHNLATKTAYTKRGIGTALTLYMMEQAKQLGFKHCFLDSSEEGFNLYKKVGFKVYSTTLIYTKP